jgi:hypothetical protein
MVHVSGTGGSTYGWGTGGIGVFLAGEPNLGHRHNNDDNESRTKNKPSAHMVCTRALFPGKGDCGV